MKSFTVANILIYLSKKKVVNPGYSSNTSKPTIADLVGSSCYDALSDDALKDEDNAGWVMELESGIRDEWIERIGWIRLADRFAEQSFLYPEHSEFDQFMTDWQYLRLTGNVKPKCLHQDVLKRMQFCGLGQLDNPISQSWSCYMEAISCYHVDNLIIGTFDEYEKMLADLAGSFFQVFPFLSEKHRQAASHFGILDQFYNHLRDLREDTERGLCYLPEDLLKDFNVDRNSILDQSACQDPRYFDMMTFWLDTRLEYLRLKARQFITAKDLHPSWNTLRDWSNHRYQRIEQVFRECNFNYVLFPDVYWSRVKDELPTRLEQVRSEYSRPKSEKKFICCQSLQKHPSWTNLQLSPST